MTTDHAFTSHELKAWHEALTILGRVLDETYEALEEANQIFGPAGLRPLTPTEVAERVRAKQPGKRGPRGFLGGDPAQRQELVDYCVSRRAESPPVPLRRVALEAEGHFGLDRTPSPSTIQRLVDSAETPEETSDE